MKKSFTTLIFVMGLAFMVYAHKKDSLPKGIVINAQALQQETGKCLLYWKLAGGRYKPVSLESEDMLIRTKLQ
ncbi:MAG: hypothetical protein V4450_07980 [Bacteroidota bacterium]